MRRAAIILMVLTILSLGLLPTGAPSQEEHDSGPPSFTDSGLPHNVGTMAEMMRDIHQVLHLGPLNSNEAQQVSVITTRLGVMMEEMDDLQAEQFQSCHRWELQEMKKHLAEIKAKLESRRK
ncbi:MAG: hypothetical protein ACYC6G_00285 [Desulfobaccales bacterium]